MNVRYTFGSEYVQIKSPFNPFTGSLVFTCDVSPFVWQPRAAAANYVTANHGFTRSCQSKI